MLLDCSWTKPGQLSAPEILTCLFAGPGPSCKKEIRDQQQFRAQSMALYAMADTQMVITTTS